VEPNRKKEGGRWLASDLERGEQGRRELHAAAGKRMGSSGALALMGAEAEEWLEGGRLARVAHDTIGAWARLMSGPNAAQCPMLFIQMIFKWIQI
jgi:hypothetical protein